MKCIVCDRCKKIIETTRNCRVITCAKPLKLPTENCKTPYRGNDRQQNDIIWEKEICADCLDALEEFFEQSVEPTTPPETEQPEQPDNSGDGNKNPPAPDNGETTTDGSETGDNGDEL